jgi:hypothetical protein
MSVYYALQERISKYLVEVSDGKGPILFKYRNSAEKAKSEDGLDVVEVELNIGGKA